MKLPTLALVPLLLVTAAATTAQGVPDRIPTDPTESLADRERERFEERYRATISRFSTTGSFGLTPAGGEGIAYQLNVNANLHFRNGDAAFLFLNTRDTPSDGDSSASLLRPREMVYTGGIGYQVSAMRLLGPHPLARRGALNLGLGAMAGDGTALALEIEPTYDLLEGRFWSLPIGVKLSLATFESRDASLTGAFFTISLGIQRHFGHRERLELK